MGVWAVLCENSNMAGFSVAILGPPPRLSRERRLAVVGSDAVTVRFLAEGELPTQRPNLLLAPILRAGDALHLLRSLDHLRLDADVGDRAGGSTLVGAWFPTPWISPEPLAPFVDLALLGGEELLGRLTAILRSIQPADHPELLTRLATLPGFYIPSLYRAMYEPGGSLAGLERVDPMASLPVRAVVPAVVPPPLPADLAWSSFPSAELLRARAVSGEKSLAVWIGASADLEPRALGEAAELLQETGIHQLHLGFWVGSPEEPEAHRALPRWVKRLRHELLSRLRREEALPALSVSAHCFVPRPWTAWQWAPMASMETLKSELHLLRNAFCDLPVLFTHDLPKWAMVEGLIARGDRRVSDVLRLADRVGWERAWIESLWNPAFYVYRARSPEERFPWDHFEWGIDRAALRRAAIRDA